MTSFVINSDTALQKFFGTVREAYFQSRYLRFTMKTGKDRSLDQNAISHAWYQQLANELREEDALGWKCQCKLRIGVPLLCSEDEEYRAACYAVIKPLSYENRLIAMRHWPVTSLMTKPQLSKYLEMMQADFAKRGVLLEFPLEGK